MLFRISFQVVANKNNGIDVDKWEYFARDSLMLGVSNSFDHIRIMNFVRVCEVEGKMQLCTRDKVTVASPLTLVHFLATYFISV